MTTTELLKTELIGEADKYLQANQVPALPFKGYLNYLEKGERLFFEEAYFARRRQMVSLALAYQINGNKEYLPLLEQVLWEICNEYSWALPAHLPMVAGQFTEESPQTIDLFAAETAQALAEILEALSADLAPFLVDRIKVAINQRIFEPLDQKTWEWESLDNNWSAVIGGSIGMAALALYPNDQAFLSKLVDRLDHVMQAYLSGFGDDGACVEGVGYWAYGFGYFIYYAEKLARVLGDKRYLTLPKTKEIAAFPYYVETSPQAFVPFSDYSDAELPSGLLSYCHDHLGVKIPGLPRISGLDFDHCYRYAHVSRNLFWTSPAILSEDHSASSHYFTDSQWLVIREPANQFVFGAKGGHNEESHNHLDVGHFVIGDYHELFLEDLGAGEYTRDYFQDATRYHYFVNNALSHHLPMINGQSQLPGKVGAEKVSYHPGGLAEFHLDLTKTYGEAAKLIKFERVFRIDSSQRLVEVTDTFIFNGEDNLVQENYISKIKPIMTKPVQLVGRNNTLLLSFSEPHDQKQSEIQYSDHHGQEQTVYAVQPTYHLGLADIIKATFRFA